MTGTFPGQVHPRAVEIGADEVAVIVVLIVDRDLAQIPDVAEIVLGVPIEGIFDQHAVVIGSIADHECLDTFNRLGVVGCKQVANKSLRSVSPSPVSGSRISPEKLVMVPAGSEKYSLSIVLLSEKSAALNGGRKIMACLSRSVGPGFSRNREPGCAGTQTRRAASDEKGRTGIAGDWLETYNLVRNRAGNAF